MAQAESNSRDESQVTTAADVLGAEKSVTEKTEASTQVQDERISPKLQVLLKREKTALERERSAKQREADIEAKAKALEEREARVAEFEQIKKTNPRKALELLGMSYQDLTQVEMNDGQVPADLHVRRLDEKLNSLVQTQEAAQRMQEENAKKLAEEQESKTVETFKTEISTYLKDNPDRYELIAFEGQSAEALVYDVIDEHYARTMNEETGVGEVLTIAQAADKVEEHFEKKYQKAPELKKIQAFLSRKTETKTPAKPQTQFGQKQTTLTNQLSATQTPRKTTPINDDDRVKRALEWLKSQRG